MRPAGRSARCRWHSNRRASRSAIAAGNCEASHARRRGSKRSTARCRGLRRQGLLRQARLVRRCQTHPVFLLVAGPEISGSPVPQDELTEETLVVGQKAVVEVRVFHHRMPQMDGWRVLASSGHLAEEFRHQELVPLTVVNGINYSGWKDVGREVEFLQKPCQQEWA